MNLADAFHALAISGCRLAADPDGGIAMTVPEGATVPSEVLDVLRAHRGQLAASMGQPPAPPAATPAQSDLRDYLGTKGIDGQEAELVEHAARAFTVPHDRITVEMDGGRDSKPLFFEHGIPCRITVDTLWHQPGHGYRTTPAGTFALAIPQTWAIADAFERNGIDNALQSAKRRRQPLHVPIWMEGQARIIEANLITFDHVVAPDGTNLVPWRSTPCGSPSTW